MTDGCFAVHTQRQETCEAVHDLIVLSDDEKPQKKTLTVEDTPEDWKEYSQFEDGYEAEDEDEAMDDLDDWADDVDYGKEPLVEGCETPLSDLSDTLIYGLDRMTTPMRVMEQGESSRQRGSRYLCGLCYVQEAIRGDLCQECWEFDNNVNQMIEEKWPRMSIHSHGKSQEDPIVISDNED